QNILPFATSVCIHIGFIILIFATYHAAEKLLKVVQEQIIIPDATLLSDPGDIGAILGSGNASRGQAAGGVSNSSAGALAQFGNPGGGETGPRGKVFG